MNFNPFLMKNQVFFGIDLCIDFWMDLGWKNEKKRSHNDPADNPADAPFDTFSATFSGHRFLDAFGSPFGSLLAPFSSLLDRIRPKEGTGTTISPGFRVFF